MSTDSCVLNFKIINLRFRSVAHTDDAKATIIDCAVHTHSHTLFFTFEMKQLKKKDYLSKNTSLLMIKNLDQPNVVCFSENYFH